MRPEVKVIVSAPTGSGVTLIGMLLYEALSKVGLTVTVDSSTLNEFEERLETLEEAEKFKDFVRENIPVTLITTNENLSPKKRPVYRRRHQ